MRRLNLEILRASGGGGGGGGGLSIGLLDMFGFEHFERNSLEQVRVRLRARARARVWATPSPNPSTSRDPEQLLINYANEKLQHLFNEIVFEIEELEYAGLGVGLGLRLGVRVGGGVRVRGEG